MTATEQTRCRHCHRVLRSAKSVAAGAGRTCQRKIRRAENTADLAGYKPAQIAAARELLDDGAIVPLRSVIFITVSTDGTETYKTAPTACNCPAGLKGHRCYHTAAARLWLAA